MLITDVTKKVEIPHEPGEFMVFRKLSWRQLELAANVASDESLKRVKKIGSDVLTALRKLWREQESEFARDPATKYDRGIVLEAGIVEWSYDAEVNKKNIDSLDEETADWAFREILSLGKPKTEEERKNG